MKKKMAVVQLSSCFGCQQSLLNAGPKVLDLFSEIDIKYWVSLVDSKLSDVENLKDKELDFTLVEGPVRNVKDGEVLKLFGEKSKVIIAYGSCAGCGGIIGLANQWTKEDLLSAKYKEQDPITDKNPQIPTEYVPEITSMVKLSDDFTPTQAYLAGCPPRTELIFGMFQHLLGEREFPMGSSSVCEDCKFYEDGCLLDANQLCFGSITSFGCKKKCPEQHKPCVGCFGPTQTPPDKSLQLKVILESIDLENPENKRIIYQYFSLVSDLTMMVNYDHIYPIIPTSNYDENIQDIIKICFKIVHNLRIPRYKFTSDFHEYSVVCDECSRTRGNLSMTKLKRDYEELPNQEDCLIEQGYICLGPVTRSGCGGSCLKVNAPCHGCYVASQFGFKPRGRAAINLYVDTILRDFNIALTKDEILTQLDDPVGIIERFTVVRNLFYRDGVFKGLQGKWWVEQPKPKKPTKSGDVK